MEVFVWLEAWKNKRNLTLSWLPCSSVCLKFYHALYLKSNGYRSECRLLNLFQMLSVLQFFGIYPSLWDSCVVTCVRILSKTTLGKRPSFLLITFVSSILGKRGERSIPQFFVLKYPAKRKSVICFNEMSFFSLSCIDGWFYWLLYFILDLRSSVSLGSCRRGCFSLHAFITCYL